MSMLNKEDARRIAKKLEAEVDKSAKAHDIAVIYFEGVEVVSFGIRRGRKDLGHDHIMRSLFVTPREARKLADCTLSRKDWIEKMKTKGLIGSANSPLG